MYLKYSEDNAKTLLKVNWWQWGTTNKWRCWNSYWDHSLRL